MPFDPRRGALDVLFLDGRNWRLASTLGYWTKQGESVCVPAGFVTDFASIPRGLWNIFPPAGPYAPAAVIHDFLYRGGRFEGPVINNYSQVGRRPTRREADAIFYDVMRELGISPAKRSVIWLAVRAFGRRAYQEAHVSKVG
jgi:hypothetical protein